MREGARDGHSPGLGLRHPPSLPAQVSVKFDPYHALSLPLPTPSKVGVAVSVERTSTDLVHHFHRWLVPTRDDAVASPLYAAATDHTPLHRDARFELHGLSLDKADRASSIAAGVAGAAGISNKRLYVFRCDDSFNALALDTTAMMSTIADGYSSIFAAELLPHALAVPPAASAAGGEEAARGAWARLKPSWWPDRPEELGGEDLKRLSLLVDHLTVEEEAAALASAVPSSMTFQQAAKGAAMPGPPNLVSLPRSASLAHVRYAIAAAAFCFVERAALIRVLSQLGELPVDAAAAPPPPDHVLLYHMARTLPIATTRGLAAPHNRSIDWLPTFDRPAAAAPAVGDGGGSESVTPPMDGRAVRLDEWLHFTGPVPPSRDDPTRPRDLFLSCNVVWRGVWAQVLDPDRASTQHAADSVELVRREVQAR